MTSEDIKDKTKFAYTLSSRYNMVSQVLRSIESLKKFINPENIIIFYTPPRDNHDLEVLQSLKVDIRKVDRISPSFDVRLFGENRGYGEKLHICNIESENVVFLDCDTIITSDIWETLEGNFEFKARPDDSGINEESWNRLFEEHKLDETTWMPNTGFMIFKNRTHKNIKDKWKNYLEADINYFDGGMQLKDEITLAMALSGYKMEKMTKKEHWMEWTDETMKDTYVHHLHTPTHWTFFQHFFISLDRNMNSLLSKIRYKTSKMF